MPGATQFTTSCTAPLLSSPAPTASMAKISAIRRPSTKDSASSASMQRVPSTTATPMKARSRIGAISKADRITTPASTATTMGACLRR